MQKNKKTICQNCFWNDNDGCYSQDHGQAAECTDYYEFEQAMYDLKLREVWDDDQ